VSTKIKFSGLEGPERLLGQRILEFELTGVLGAGGMSVVYRGTHRVTGQEVAIKILPPELATHDELKARFVEEARVLAKLEHPQIVSLNNFAEAGGRLCLIMQFVEGKTFEKQIQEGGRVGWEETVRVGIEVLKALEYAHDNNCVHRDIKPSNVLIRPDGVVKVTDFGIARMLGGGRLTSTGQTMGTVRYMSPEQVRGKSVDHRSDLYSLGVTLYEALTGHTPFDGDNQFDIMQQHLGKKPPPLEQFSVEVPGILEAALMKSLEKDPQKRWQDAKTMRDALEAVLSAPLAARAPKKHRPKWVGRVTALALGMIVAGAAGVGLYFILRQPAELPELRKKTGPQKPKLVEPHKLPGVQLTVDQAFEDDGVRIQSANQRDAAALLATVRDIKAKLALFMAQSSVPALKDSASQAPTPFTVTVVPQTFLDTPSLWPGFNVKSDTSYPSRYVAQGRTVFVADAPGFETKELPYQIALHVFARIGALATEQVNLQAEAFAAWYLQKK
jgi:serine/threonine-protein kinase